MKTVILLALCVVLSSATPMNIVLDRMSKFAYEDTLSRETVYVTNDNPYVSGANSITDMRIGVSVVGKPPKGSSLIITPEGSPVVGAITAESYAPFYFSAKGSAGIWMLKITVTFLDERNRLREKSKYFPYIIKAQQSTKDVVEEGDANDWTFSATPSLESRATCPSGSSNELVATKCNFNAVVDQKQFNNYNFYPNTVSITSLVSINTTSTTCTTFLDNTLNCNTPIAQGQGCAVSFAVKCPACGQAGVNIILNYKTSTSSAAPTRSWNSGSIGFIVTAGTAGCRRDVAEQAIEERAIESGRIKKSA